MPNSHQLEFGIKKGLQNDACYCSTYLLQLTDVSFGDKVTVHENIFNIYLVLPKRIYFTRGLSEYTINFRLKPFKTLIHR